jgi:hypothetical protein
LQAFADFSCGLTEIARDVLTDTRRGKNGRHGLVGQFRQSVFGRLGGYDDVNGADRLRPLVGGERSTAGFERIPQPLGRISLKVRRVKMIDWCDLPAPN